MNLVWTQHLRDPKDKANFSKTVKSAIVVLDRLKEIFKGKVNSLEDLTLSSLEKRNWELIQAYNLGYRACANDLNTLVDLDPKQQRNNL